MSKGPDPRWAAEKYRRHAAGYDASAERTLDVREAVPRFAAFPHDVGC